MPHRPDRPIPLSGPDLSDREHRYVADVLRSGRLAMGPYLRAFERRMAEVAGTRHAVAVSSGTAALHCIIAALGLEPGDEVITTPFGFVASANVLLYAGATPRFVDVDPHTLNLDPARVEAALTPRTRALLAVDVFGHPADWPALTPLARRHGLALVDDACEAPGAVIGGRPIGAWGDAAAFGFYPNKQMTTGEGGCVTTDSDALAARCRSLRNQGRASDARMEHVRLGFNYRMSELSAALGLAQAERLDALLERRAQVAARYDRALAELQDEIALPARIAGRGARHSWFVYVVRLRDHHPADHRDRLMRHLRARGIACAPYLPAIHLQPLYRERFGFAPGTFPTCEHAAARTLALPFHGRLAGEQVRRVAAVLREGLAALAPASVTLPDAAA